MKLPVPAGFIVTTETCLEYFQNHRQMSTQLVEEYTNAVHEIEKQTGRLFPCKILDTVVITFEPTSVNLENFLGQLLHFRSFLKSNIILLLLRWYPQVILIRSRCLMIRTLDRRSRSWTNFPSFFPYGPVLLFQWYVLLLLKLWTFYHWRISSKETFSNHYSYVTHYISLFSLTVLLAIFFLLT